MWDGEDGGEQREREIWWKLTKDKAMMAFRRKGQNELDGLRRRCQLTGLAWLADQGSEAVSRLGDVSAVAETGGTGGLKVI